MAKNFEEKQNEIIVKSNALARAHWKIESVWEPRLVALLASKVMPGDEDFHVYEIPVAELWKLGKGGAGKDYQNLKEVVKSVMSRVLEIREGRDWILYNVFSRCRFRAEDNVLELGFHPDLKPHYLQLKQSFVKYSLLEFMTLSSTYSQRLYEILKSWKDQPEVTIPMEDLHKMLDCPAYIKKDFMQFRTRILEKAHRDILANTSLTFEYELKKTGRKVTAIRFILSRARALEAQAKQVKEDQKKRTAERNQLALKAMACFQASGGTCPVKLPPKKVCTICKEMHLTIENFLEE